ncbi:MAG: nickel-binding protein [Actinomycetota bacterium]
MAVAARKFLVEVYFPKSWIDRMPVQVDRLRSATADMEAEGVSVRYVEALFVSEDETCFYVFEAASGEDVAEAGRRAGLEFQRIVRAV